MTAPRPDPSENGTAWTSRVNQSVTGSALAGYAVIALAVAGFGVWASTAPLGGAVIAPGIVAAAGQNVQVQHLEGGIVKEIAVRDGQRIKAGDTLVVLDDTAALVNLNRLEKQAAGLTVRLVRLRAERDGLDSMAVDAQMAASTDPALKEALTEQVSEFAARLSRYRSELKILGQRSEALDENMAGLEAQKKSIAEQIAVVSEEMNRKKDLLDRGLTNRSEYTALLRSEADLTGRLGDLESQIAGTRVRMAEAQEQIERQTTERVETAVSELTEARLKLDDLLEQINGARAVLERTVVRSPVDGIVVRMEVNVAGTVVAPGKAMLEILPTSDDLLVEARINPRDIDIVKIGQAAKLRFSALNSRTTPEFPGTVTYVSADRIVDARDQSSYFAARLAIDEAATGPIDREQIYPGTPVETFIATGDRTFFEYLLKPLTDSVNRAFREE